MNQTTVDKAQKKFDGCVDRLIDLLNIVPDQCTYKVNELLDKVRDAEYSVISRMEEQIKR
jgi:hypothetical protein